MISAIVAAAGKGTRFGNFKKQFLKLNNETLIKISVKKLIKAGIDEIVVVAPKENLIDVEKDLANLKKKIEIVAGSSTRQKSVLNGFKICSKQSSHVLIHDAARPFIEVDLILKLIELSKTNPAATIAVKPVDTVKILNPDGKIKTLNRNLIFLTQTPQIFKRDLFEECILKNSTDLTDECQLFEQLNLNIKFLLSSKTNIKITTKEDFELAKLMLKSKIVSV